MCYLTGSKGEMGPPGEEGKRGKRGEKGDQGMLLTLCIYEPLTSHVILSNFLWHTYTRNPKLHGNIIQAPRSLG